MTYRRTARQVREDSDEDYRLLLPTTGHITLRNRDHEVGLQSGTACLMTTDQPFEFTQVHHTQAFVMTIPRREVDHRLNRAAPLARQLNLRPPARGR